ncbi:MAG: sugar ABC transporter ATP-binding protein [Oscillospiraceae bacterium]
MQSDIVLKVEGINKSFPGVRALKDMSLEIARGEVHAVCGENGAGKSTLMKILTGVYSRDSGEYYFEGKPVDFKNTQQSMHAGIACIYQELTMVPLLDVAKNLFLGNPPFTKQGTIDSKTMYREAKNLLKRINLDVPVKRLVADLSIAQQQMLEIGRALTRNAKVIIMDEPTSSLSENEKNILHNLIRSLKADGVSIIYISHKLEDILEISDRITVIRDGEKIITLNTKETNKNQLISYMIGRTLDNLYNKTKAPIGGEALRVEGLTRKGVFEDVSFNAHYGEVVGFFGLVGSGRSEIMRAVFGVDKLDKGKIFIDGKPVRIKSPVKAVKKGLALVPENRKLEGLAVRLSVLFNMTIVKINELNILGFIRKKAQADETKKFISATSIKTPTIKQKLFNLSGGNQQKVVISKWLMMNTKILILDEPTRGIDVAAKSEVYGLISKLANGGVSVIVVSSEIPEILGICDRLYTVCEGRISGEMPVEGITSEEILASALGGSQNG